MNTSRSHGRQGSYSLSYNKDGRELMTPDELSNMDNINCIVFIRGLLPFFSKKYDLEKHPHYHLTGDANNNHKFDVKEMLHTGFNLGDKPERSKSNRLIEEAHIADTRTSQREHRYHNRPVRETTAGGRRCLESKPTNELFPYVGIPLNNLTPEQLHEQTMALEHIELEKVNVPPQDVYEQKYQEELDIDYEKLQMHLDMQFYGSGDESRGVKQYVDE